MSAPDARVEAAAKVIILHLGECDRPLAEMLATESLAAADRAALSNAEGVVRDCQQYAVGWSGIQIDDVARTLQQAAATIQAMAAELTCRKAVATCWDKLPTGVDARTAHRLHDCLDDWPSEDDAPQAATIVRVIDEIAADKTGKLPMIYANYKGEFFVEWTTEEELATRQGRMNLNRRALLQPDTGEK